MLKTVKLYKLKKESEAEFLWDCHGRGELESK